MRIFFIKERGITEGMRKEKIGSLQKKWNQRRIKQVIRQRKLRCQDKLKENKNNLKLRTKTIIEETNK